MLRTRPLVGHVSFVQIRRICVRGPASPTVSGATVCAMVTDDPQVAQGSVLSMDTTLGLLAQGW